MNKRLFIFGVLFSWVVSAVAADKTELLNASYDDYYDAKVKVLSEMIKHHVNEEEKRDGMFAKARQSDLDLKELGTQLAARKQELMGEGAKPNKIAARRSREPGVLARLAQRVRSSR